jgi:hypothetical protein
MTAIEYEIFDDLLIGNFMKTTLHGQSPQWPLYPDFTPYVAKYADNGLAKSKEELNAYFKTYRKRAPFDYFLHRLQKQSSGALRSIWPTDSSADKLARSVYHSWRYRG